MAERFWSGTTLDGEKVAVLLDITDDMIDRAAEAIRRSNGRPDDDWGIDAEQLARDALQAALTACDEHASSSA